MNTIEAVMPEGLEQEVFEGLNDEQKQVIITQAQCESLMDYIMGSIRKAQANEQIVSTLGNMAADVFSMAMAYALHKAGVESDEQAHDLLARGQKFSASAKAVAEAAHKEKQNAQPE